MSSAERTQKRVLVTGATGFIGGYLAGSLHAAGHAVRILVRDPLRWSGADVEVLRGDLDDVDTLRRAVRGMDRVYHVAGLTKAFRDDEFFAVNHQGTVRLLDTCARESRELERFILVSSQAAAGPALAGKPVTEDDAPHPTSSYGVSKLRAELAAEAHRVHFPFTIVRPPVVYGPRDRDTLLVFRVARWGIVPRLGRLRRLSIVHVADLVRGICLAADAPSAENRVYFLANRAPATLPELTRPVAAEFGMPAIPLPLPGPPLYAVAAVSELVASVRRRRTPLTRKKLADVLQLEWICDSSRAARELGWESEIPLEAGIRTTARWYRRAGWL